MKIIFFKQTLEDFEYIFFFNHKSILNRNTFSLWFFKDPVCSATTRCVLLSMQSNARPKKNPKKQKIKLHKNPFSPMDMAALQTMSPGYSSLIHVAIYPEDKCC